MSDSQAQTSHRSHNNTTLRQESEIVSIPILTRCMYFTVAINFNFNTSSRRDNFGVSFVNFPVKSGCGAHFYLATLKKKTHKLCSCKEDVPLQRGASVCVYDDAQ